MLVREPTEHPLGGARTSLVEFAADALPPLFVLTLTAGYTFYFYTSLRPEASQMSRQASAEGRGKRCFAFVFAWRGVSWCFAHRGYLKSLTAEPLSLFRTNCLSECFYKPSYHLPLLAAHRGNSRRHITRSLPKHRGQGDQKLKAPRRAEKRVNCSEENACLL